MLHRVKYESCICCGSSSIHNCFSAIDYTVTREIFEIWECTNCTFRFTQNVPDVSHIGPYYQSYNYISHSDTKEGLINRIYHIVRNITLRSKRKIIQSVTQLSQGYLLDYGAGTGAFSHIMKKNNWTVTGIEPDDNARANAHKNYNLDLQKLSYFEQLEGAKYDAITLWHVLEHVHNIKPVLKKFNELLKPKGKLVIAVPNFTSYDAGHYREFWAAYDVPRHLYHFSPRAMEVLLQNEGFIVEKKYPMWFDSLYVSMLSEQNKTGSNNLVKSIFIGLISNLKTLINVSKCSSVIYVASKKY